MPQLTSFHFITLDGYYADPRADTSWHEHDGEGAAYAEESLEPGSTLLFGRVTYEFMASFWPTPMAAEFMPGVAAKMNRAEKIVFSRTLASADWKGTTVIREDAVEMVRRLKKTSAKDLTLLGSASLLCQLAAASLIDEFRFMVDPLVLGDGRSIFKGVPRPLRLKLATTRTFANGAALLCYRPA